MNISYCARLAIVLCIVALLSCAHSLHTKKNEMKIKIEIVKGETNEVSILHLLGTPASITTDHAGNEIWSYHNFSFSTTRAPERNSVIFWALSTGARNETPGPFDFKIIFDQNDVVKNYEIIQKSF